MRRLKRAAGIMLSLLMTATSITQGAMPSMAKATQQNAANVYADWIFDENHIKSGSISTGDLIFEDKSGNGNDIAMQAYDGGNLGAAINYADYISFEKNSMSSEYSLGSAESVALTPSEDFQTGVDFITTGSAPINSEDFQNGYTLEFVYRVEEEGISPWSSIMARQGDALGSNEPELGTMNIAFSSERSVQFKTADYQDNVNNTMNRDAWTSPVAMKKTDAWYHIAITSDGDAVELYVNGMETARGYYNKLEGMFADPADGRFRIGSAYWEGELDKLLAGSLERVRISEGVVGKQDWVIPDPVSLVKPETLEGNQNGFAMTDSGKNYNMVIIPDTQYVVQGKSSIMEDAVKWLTDNKDSAKISAVMHLGDLTESTNGPPLAQEWENARNSFYQLADSGMKAVMVRGNHDSQSEFVNNMGPGSDWADTMEAKNPGAVVHEPNDGLSSYMTFEAGSYRYMVVAIGYGRASDDAAWLSGVLDKNPNIPTIVISHDLVSRSFGLSNAGRNIWNVARAYDQVFMMVGGHYNGYGNSILTNDAGNPVINILADYQDEYMGGNAWFKFAEFDEENNKIYFKTFSPYVDGKQISDRTYFDRTYLTGDGHDDVFEVNFKERFNFNNAVKLNKNYQTAVPGDEIQLTAKVNVVGVDPDAVVWSSSNEKVAAVDQNGKVVTAGKGTAEIRATAKGVDWLYGSFVVNVREKNAGSWMAGEYHVHSGMSPDINNVDYTTVKNLLDTGFEKNGLDYLVMADHLRMTNTNAENQPLGSNIAYYKALSNYLLPYLDRLQSNGKYQDKILYTGFEMDLQGFDHVSVAMLPENGNEVPVDGVKEFEYYYSKDTQESQFTAEDIAKYGARKNSNDRKNAYDAISWLDKNYPNSYLLLNHPSRYSGKDRADELFIEDIRAMNDLAPDTVFGFEGIPGNQMSNDGARGELPYGYVLGGADVMIAKVGGVWDALLGEGRNFWNFANSDFHFKLNNTGIYASGYWPGEYTKNYTYVEGNDMQAVAGALRSGKSFSVMGDLINELDYSIMDTKNTAEMGETITVSEGDGYTITIKFKSPETNNYEPITSGHQSSVTNKVSVDHVDLISGEVTGKISADDPDYSKGTNDTAKVVKRFTSEDWEVDKDGYCVISYKVDSADTDRYYRLRGTNLGTDVPGMTAGGEPLPDETISVDHTDDTTAAVGFNEINDRNYSNMWFYSNPIFVNVGGTSAAKHIHYVAGYEDKTFKPEKNLSRAEAASMIFSLLETTGKDIPEMPEKSKFSDIKTDEWYSNAILTLAEMGVISGYDDGTFKPDALISRAEFAAMAVIYSGVELVPGTTQFKDVSENHWAKPFINAAKENDFINGYAEDQTFRPLNNIKRVEAVSILNGVDGRDSSTLDIENVENPFTDIAGHWGLSQILEAAVDHDTH